MSTNMRDLLQPNGVPPAWDRFAAASIDPWPLGLLCKFAAANINPYGAQVGEFLAARFRLSAHGTRFASYGYNNLAVHEMSSSSLVFGFGNDHIIRVHSENTGFVLLILLGTLMEYYHQDFLPLVLHEMSLDLGIPPKLLMSPVHWRAQLRAFNGVLVNTKFGILVDESVRLNPHRESIVTQKVESMGTTFGSSPASPKSVAKILKALGALSMGGTETLTIIGGDDGGLFAAMADWLFGLRTVIRSDSGKELRSNCDGQEPQVVVIFSPAATTNPSAELGMQQMQLTGVTCQLAGDGRKEGENKEGGLEPTHPASPGGRINWASLAADVYGSDFMALLRTSQSDIHFGAIIGSAARVFEGLVAESKDATNGSSISFNWRSATPGSYGAGLIQTLIAYFPDMSRARPRMERPLKLSFTEARSAYEKEVAKLVAFCDCPVCHIGDSSPPNDRRHCLVVIVESTVTLGLLLAKTIVSPEVYPRRAGVEGFYHYWASVRQELNRKSAEIALEDRFAFIYRDALMLLKGGVMLSACLCLFSATLPSIPDPKALAFSCNGIVAYSGLLHGSIGYKREWDASTRVMAGVIQYQGRVYRSVVADAALMEKIEKGEMIADPDTEYEIVEPQDPEQALVLRLKT